MKTPKPMPKPQHEPVTKKPAPAPMSKPHKPSNPYVNSPNGTQQKSNDTTIEHK